MEALFAQMLRMLKVAPGLAENCRQVAGGEAWLERLPTLVGELLTGWELTLRSTFDDAEGTCAWVARVTRRDGSAAVLKLGLPHFEAEHEIAGLRFWDGEGTARLLAADESNNALLLEDCSPGTPLRALPESEQDAVLGELLPRLWRAPREGFAFRPLYTMLDYWAAATLADVEQWPDAGLVRQGLSLLGELDRSTARRVVLFTDLHAGNVLRAEREPWLAIDPKPFVGDPAYDATQHLFNCLDRMLIDPRRVVADFASRLSLPAGRVRLWTFARAAAQPRSDWREDPWLRVARLLD